MKRIVLIILIITAGITSALAGDTDPGKKGFWTIEDNAEDPAMHTFKFYYDDSHLLYQETVDFDIDVSQKDVQEKLNTLLAELVTEHEQKEADSPVEFKYLASL